MSWPIIFGPHADAPEPDPDPPVLTRCSVCHNTIRRRFGIWWGHRRNCTRRFKAPDAP